MGLAEKRAKLAEKRIVEGFKTSQFTEFQKQIEGIVGMSVEFDIAWDDFCSQIEGMSYPAEAMSEYMAGMFFHPMINAFKSICSDDMGKTALKESLKKIQILNSGNYYSDSGVTYDSGVLRLDFKYTNVDQVADRETAIRTKIESAL